MTDLELKELEERLHALPADLQDHPFWCGWRKLARDGRATKVPIDVATGAPASTASPDTFHPLAETLTGIRKFDLNGLGILLADGLAAVDLDHCMTDDGTLAPTAIQVLGLLSGAYIEVSPSGHGLHLLFRVPEDFGFDSERYYSKNTRRGVEFYVGGQSPRYMTVTASPLPGCDVPDRLPVLGPAVLQSFLNGLMKRPATPSRATPPPVLAGYGRGPGLDDDEILELLLRQRDGGRAAALWAGGSLGYNSPSEADLAMCKTLSFYTQDSEQIDRLFRQSGLMREKWDSRRGGTTYGQMTVKKALAGQAEHYGGGRGRLAAARAELKRRKEGSKKVGAFARAATDSLELDVSEAEPDTGTGDEVFLPAGVEESGGAALGKVTENESEMQSSGAQPDSGPAAEEIACWEDLMQTYGDLIPSVLAQVGEAEALRRFSEDLAVFTKSAGWLVYDGTRWRADALGVDKLLQDLLWQQHALGVELIRCAQAEGEQAERDETGKKKKKQNKHLDFSNRFLAFTERSMSGGFGGVLERAKPLCFIEDAMLDRDAEILNTPRGVVNLRTGEMLPHDPRAYLAKCTSCAPGDEGRDLFLRFLNELTGGDGELQNYLQAVAGMACIGEVFEEKVLVCYGPGGNGKTTFWGSLAAVLGDYARSFPPELLTREYRGNPAYAKAELRGVRLAIGAELDDGRTLNTGLVKQICSTDKLSAERKFKDPFEFVPSHTCVLFTNTLPETRSTDTALWDRIQLVPMTQRFRDTQGEIKNYKSFLAGKAGPAILRWAVDGARRFIAAGHVLPACEAVRRATELYKKQSDTLGDFLTLECLEDPDAFTPTAALYVRFRQYLSDSGERVPTCREMVNELKRRGFGAARTRDSRGIKGIKLRISY